MIIITKAMKSESKEQFEHGVRIGFLPAIGELYQLCVPDTQIIYIYSKFVQRVDGQGDIRERREKPKYFSLFLNFLNCIYSMIPDSVRDFHCLSFLWETLYLWM